MAIVINGTGTITGISATNGLADPQTGSVLQVIQGTLAGAINTASTSFVTTGLTATITPKFSTSKILIITTLVNTYSANSGVAVSYTTYRGSTNIAPSGSGVNQCFGKIYGTGSGNLQTQCYSYLDSPATTSATTYTIYFAVNTSTGYINQDGTTSYIQLLEIAA
jgi:hypothetical protein